MSAVLVARLILARDLPLEVEPGVNAVQLPHEQVGQEDHFGGLRSVVPLDGSMSERVPYRAECAAE